MKVDTLAELRKQIDAIDESILELLEKRMTVTDQVGEYKRQNKVSILQKGREEELKKKLQNLAIHPVLTQKIDTIFQPIIEASKLSMHIQNLKKTPFSRIGILGFGVIGGSIAKTLKAKDFTIVISTVKRESEDMLTAARLGFVDHAYESLEAFVNHNDLIIIATPLDIVEDIAESIAKVKSDKKVIVIDVASVKKSIVEKFEKISNGSIEFLSTHPMTGSEKTGIEGASIDLFMNKPWIIVPHSKSKSETIGKIKEFIESLGGNSELLDEKKHDEYSAIVSHLVFLISSYLFAFAQNTSDSLKIAGTGFETTTRLSSGNAKMQSQIVEQNFENVMIQMKNFIDFMKSNQITKENALDFFEKNKSARDKYFENRK